MGSLAQFLNETYGNIYNHAHSIENGIRIFRYKNSSGKMKIQDISEWYCPFNNLKFRAMVSTMKERC